MADGVVYVNVEEALKRVMNNSKLLAKLLKKFKDDKNLIDLEAALAANDLPKSQINAHTLKGLAANLSLTELYKQVLELETQIKAGSVAPGQLDTVKTIYAQTLIEVDKVIAKYE
jgi:HPt (histidine-containing phosphotransfer) domain-containing protein